MTYSFGGSREHPLGSAHPVWQLEGLVLQHMWDSPWVGGTSRPGWERATCQMPFPSRRPLAELPPRVWGPHKSILWIAEVQISDGTYPRSLDQAVKGSSCQMSPTSLCLFAPEPGASHTWTHFLLAPPGRHLLPHLQTLSDQCLPPGNGT